MKRFVTGVGAVALVAAAALLSRWSPAVARPEPRPLATPELAIEVGAKNPWTHLRLNDAPDKFQFAVVADRTGGHRPKVFSRAVKQINLLQPNFVLSVGDLIEGYATDPGVIDRQWAEFDGFARDLQMPFFYATGNHDLAYPVMGQKWDERYGRRHYHFVYKNVLFLIVDSEDPPGSAGVRAEQRADLKKALDANPGVRWTFVLLHQPLWVLKDAKTNGWADVEGLLAGRKYTVFCGHLHRYRKYPRNGMNYYQLATTGGVSKLRGPAYGEFDQVAWVTVPPAADPVVTNVLLDGILPENLTIPDTEEPGRARKYLPTHPARAAVTLDGKPLPKATVAFVRRNPAADPDKKWISVADGLTAADGSAALSTYTPNDGCPAGEYLVTVATAGRYRDPNEDDARNTLPDRYDGPSSTPLRATVTADGKNEFDFALTSK